jgi:hypothetical protein
MLLKMYEQVLMLVMYDVCHALPFLRHVGSCCVVFVLQHGQVLGHHALALCSLPDSARCNRDVHHSATCIHTVSALLWQAVHLKELMVTPLLP